MKLLLLDFETDGKDPKTCNPIEFACQLYDTDTRERGKPYSQLIWEGYYPEISDEITELTGIDSGMLQLSGIPQSRLVQDIDQLVKKANYLVAFNIGFDQTILERLYYGFQLRRPVQPWFCAMMDLPWPKRLQRCRQLQHRALDLGIPMDGRDSHRAMADVTLLGEVFDKWEDLNAVFEYWQWPDMYVRAIVPPPWNGNGGDGGVGRDQAKEAGFGWEKSPGEETPVFSKWWVRKFKEGTDLSELPFPTEIVG